MTFTLVWHDVDEVDEWDDDPGLADETARALTAAPLSCHSLRRLLITDWWLSPNLPASPSPALPHLDSLHVEVVMGIDEETLAVLFDAAPHLQELTLDTQPLDYDVLVWVGDRYHELRTLIIQEHTIEPTTPR